MATVIANEEIRELLDKLARLTRERDALLAAAQAVVALIVPAGYGPGRLPDNNETRAKLDALRAAIALAEGE